MDCKLIAIDSSTTGSGYAVYINGILNYYGVYTTNHISNSRERLETMMRTLCQKIEEDKPDIVITELTVVNRNAEAQRNLSMLLGAIYYKCLELGIEYHSLRPTEWRKLVRNKEESIPRKREELKKWSKAKVKDIYKIDTDDDNISDAILLGQGYINKF